MNFFFFYFLKKDCLQPGDKWKKKFLWGVLHVAEKQPTQYAFFPLSFWMLTVREGRWGEALQLSESRPQSYCSLAKNDAKHSLKPIYITTPEELSAQNFCISVTLVSSLCPYLYVVLLRVTKGKVRKWILTFRYGLFSWSFFEQRSLWNQNLTVCSWNYLGDIV